MDSVRARLRRGTAALLCTVLAVTLAAPSASNASHMLLEGRLSFTFSPDFADGLECDSAHFDDDHLPPTHDAILHFMEGFFVSYAPCDGGIHPLSEDAVNTASASLGGTLGGVPFAMSLPAGPIDALFTYQPVCAGPSGLESWVGAETIGVLNVTGPATGVYGNSFVLAATFTARFWLSHAGAELVVGIDRVTLNLLTSVGPVAGLYAGSRGLGEGGAVMRSLVCSSAAPDVNEAIYSGGVDFASFQ